MHCTRLLPSLMLLSLIVCEDVDQMFERGEEYLFTTDEVERNISRAVEYYSKAAAQGHAAAQFKMGLLYTTGIGLPKSEARAILYYTFAAANGNMDAHLAMAYRHYHGYSVVKGCTEAARFYRKVADHVAKTYHVAGVLPQIEKIRLNDDAAHQQRQTDEDIMQYYQYSADKGDTNAMVVLGRAYMFGARVDQNAGLAKEYFLKAADNGEPAGWGGLGQLYAQGVTSGPVTIERNYTAAKEYFERGAKEKHPVSLNGMGFLHMGGHGVPLNYTEAARYFRQAADLSNPEALFNLGALYLNGEGVPKDLQKALQYLQAASQQGQILAHYQLGNMHLDGIGAPKKCEMAVKYYKAVAEKGNWNIHITDAYDAYVNGDHTSALLHYLVVAEQGMEIGQSNGAYMLDRGIGFDEIPPEVLYNFTAAYDGGTDLHINADLNTQRMRELALYLYKRSAEQTPPNIESILRIGDYYYYGWCTEVDYKRSADKYREASAHPQALFNLGYMHENGVELSRDYHLAKRYYDQAATVSDKAWPPVQLALGKLFVRWYLEDFLVNSKPIIVLGWKLEDIILHALLAVLAFLVWLRANALPGR